MPSCPVPYTCPLIDSVIDDHVKWAISCLKDIKRSVEKMSSEEIEKEIDHILFHFDPIPTLEKIREANHDIRTWGESEAERAEELQNDIDDLEEKVAELEAQIDDL